MSMPDILSTLGVSILIGAFISNSNKALSSDSNLYNVLDFTGAAWCGLSAYLIKFYPFVILRGAWAIFAPISLYRSVSRETLKLNSNK